MALLGLIQLWGLGDSAHVVSKLYLNRSNRLLNTFIVPYCWEGTSTALRHLNAKSPQRVGTRRFDK